MIVQRLARRLGHFLVDFKPFRPFIFGRRNYQTVLYDWARILGMMLRENILTKLDIVNRERKNKLVDLTDEEEIIEKCRTYCYPMVAHDGLIVYAAEH